MGRCLVLIVRRMLFWYTPQIMAYQAGVSQIMLEQFKALERLSAALEQNAAANARLHSRLDAWEGKLSGERTKNEDALNRLQSHVDIEIGNLSREVKALAGRISGLHESEPKKEMLTLLGTRLAALEGSLEIEKSKLAEELSRERAKLRDFEIAARAELRYEVQALAGKLSELEEQKAQMPLPTDDSLKARLEKLEDSLEVQKRATESMIWDAQDALAAAHEKLGTGLESALKDLNYLRTVFESAGLSRQRPHVS